MKELIARQCRLKVVVRKDFHDFVCAQHICDVYTNLLLCKQSSNRKCRDGFCHNPRHTLREREKVHFLKILQGGSQSQLHSVTKLVHCIHRKTIKVILFGIFTGVLRFLLFCEFAYYSLQIWHLTLFDHSLMD